MGDPVILWAFGLPFLAVYRDYYVLAGSDLRQHLWLLDKKTRHDALASQGFNFGQLLAPVRYNYTAIQNLGLKKG
jgi:hypothetical protein